MENSWKPHTFFRALVVWLSVGLSLPINSYGVFFAMPPTTLYKAIEASRKDGVGSGYCGRGVWSVLERIGYGEGIRSADGQDWEEVLAEAGWIPYDCPDPALAPYGAVLVYLSDMLIHGKNLVGTKGGLWGHVELVAKDRKGNRVYVSDKARSNAGGTVPFNFVKRAWLPPSVASIVGVGPKVVVGTQGNVLKPSIYDPMAIRQAAEDLLGDRLELANEFFASVALNQKGA